MSSKSISVLEAGKSMGVRSEDAAIVVRLRRSIAQTQLQKIETGLRHPRLVEKIF